MSRLRSAPPIFQERLNRPNILLTVDKVERAGIKRLFEISRDEPGVLKRSFSPGNAFSEPGTRARRRMRTGPVCWTPHRPTRAKAALQHSRSREVSENLILALFSVDKSHRFSYVFL